MVGDRSCPGAALAALAASLLVTLPGSAQQLPLQPARESGQSVTAAFEGWYQNPDGSYMLLVGYFNRNTKETLDIPVGPDNRIEPGGPDYGQPTEFLPRRQWGVFTIKVPRDFGDRRLTWTIVANGQSTSVPIGLVKGYQVEPFKEQAQGNEPPKIQFDPKGPVFTGPPAGIVATFTTLVGQPLPLGAVVSDNVSDPAEFDNPAQAKQAPVSVLWTKHRGAGEVTFSEPRPRVGPDGKVATTATFAQPGEYILRAQVNDRSGDGGGGFQCCWTNVHVRVTVKAGSTTK